MKKGLRIIALVLLVVTSLSALAACSDGKTYTFEDVTFTIPKNMRKTANQNVDVYYTTMECDFALQKLTPERLAVMELDESADLKTCVDAYFEKNQLDAEQCYVYYDKEQNAYKFRYSNSPDGTAYYFHYVVMIEGSHGIYFVDMVCDYENSLYYLIEFESWGKTIKAK